MVYEKTHKLLVVIQQARRKKNNLTEPFLQWLPWSIAAPSSPFQKHYNEEWRFKEPRKYAAGRYKFLFVSTAMNIAASSMPEDIVLCLLGILGIR